MMWEKRRRNIFFAFIFSSVLSYLLIFKSENVSDKESTNYFENKLKRSRGLLINTTNCKIPDFDVKDADVLPFLKNLKEVEAVVGLCREGNFNWTFVQKDKLVINLNQMKVDGYPFTPGFCCYKEIERVTMENIGNDTKRDMKMDMQLKYSECKPLYEETNLLFNSEFIMIECGNLTVPVYRSFHASAFFSLPVPTVNDSDSGNTKSSRIKRKLEHWSRQDNENAVPPPNILVVGLDSTSRLNFRRNMPQTLKVLESLGATEMNGFIKVGLNTFPNIVPMLTGYGVNDLQALCNYSARNPFYPFDPCPLVWKSFDEAKYLTAMSEDAPLYAIFNYHKAGFHQQPTDFYLRPLMIAGLHYDKYGTFHSNRSANVNCMGHQTNDELILSYVESILTLGRKKKTPVFSLSWSTSMSHNELNGIQVFDKTYANFISSLKDNGILDNTIFFFMGDHGYNYGPFRQTLLGFYEDKLPVLWIKIPPRIEREFPEWKHALEANSRRPTSFYTFYWTLSLILETFSFPTKIAPALKPRKIYLKDQTFFHVQIEHEVSNRSFCDFLGVPSQFCPCNVPKEMSTNDLTAKRAALLAIESINSRLVNSPCFPLQLKTITAAAKNEDTRTKRDHLRVSFVTSPGNYRFETEITYVKKTKSFKEISGLQRTSKVNKDLIKCNSDAGLELFCYCAN